MAVYGNEWGAAIQQVSCISSMVFVAMLQPLQMKYPLSFLWLSTFSCLIGFAQAPQADSLAWLHLRSVSNPTHAAVFRYMLQQRDSTQLRVRLDTSQYGAVFIIETCPGVKSGYRNAELYFHRNPTVRDYLITAPDSDTIPFRVLSDGNPVYHPAMYYGSAVSGIAFMEKYEYFYTWPEIRQRAAQMKPVQELEYDPTPNLGMLQPATVSTDSGAMRNSLGLLEAERIQWLKSTYQIVTYIDRETNTVKVSLQTPVSDPRIKGYSRVMRDYGW
jgi:hypothetical protein